MGNICYVNEHVGHRSDLDHEGSRHIDARCHTKCKLDGSRLRSPWTAAVANGAKLPGATENG